MARIVIPNEPSFISSVAAGRVQILVHVTVTRGGAIDTLRIVTSAEHPLKDHQRSETSRRKLREELDAISLEGGPRAAPAPGPYVAWRIHRAVEAHRAAGGAVRLGFERALAQCPDPSPAPAHPALALAPVPGAERRVLESMALHREPELLSWLPPDAALHVLAAAIERTKDQVIVRPDEPAEGDPGERRRRLLADAIDDFYGSEQRHALARDLLDTALVFEATRRHEAALDAVAVAEAIEAASKLTRPPHEIPLLFGLYYKFILLHSDKLPQR